LAHVAFYTGQFEESRRMYAAIEAAARVRGNDQHIAWGLYAAARALLPLGRVGEARAMLEDAHRLLEAQIDVPSRVIAPGLLASACSLLGDRDRARALADLTSARMRRNLPTVFATVAGYAGAAEVYLAELALAKHVGGDVRRARADVRRSLFYLAALAWSIPL